MLLGASSWCWVPCPRLCVGMWTRHSHWRSHAHAKPWAWHPACSALHVLMERRNDRFLPQQFFDLPYLAADEQDVRHLQFMGLSARGPHDQVARAQTEQPVAEQ